MKKARKKIRSKTAVTLLLLLSLTLTWLACMVCLTVTTAQTFYDFMYEGSYNYVDDAGSFLSTYYDKNYDVGRYGYLNDHPDYMEHCIFEALDSGMTIRVPARYQIIYPNLDARDIWLRDIYENAETAVVFYDNNGNLLHGSDESIIYFDYCTQEEWNVGEESAAPSKYTWIDISEGKDEGYPNDPYLRFRSSSNGRIEDCAFRMTGTFDGTQFIPVRLDFTDCWSVYSAIEGNPDYMTEDGGYSYTYSDVDRDNLIQWQNQFDRTDSYEGDPADLVTIYTDYPQMLNNEQTPLTYNGQRYDSLTQLTRELDLPSYGYAHSYSSELTDKGVYKLNELLIFSGRTYAEYANYEYREDTSVDLIMITAVRCNPLAFAMRALRNIYLATVILMLLLFLTVRYLIVSRLIRPLELVAAGMQEDWKNLYRPDFIPPMWAEADTLTGEYTQEQQLRRMRKNEITRLNTALEYAKTAEENRRQMTSNIAHELKTPLAVIHSYAEGLKEHIAEDRRDQYLDVILSEVKRTDSMVLEMLDLSRLEAGKVKLARDEFSLTELTRSVFQRLERAALGKQLHIYFQIPEQCMIHADETRIAQVIENFASNAVKYTPEGGNIFVRIQTGRSLVTFCIENESPPLSQEALTKVWDTFYRADDSRSGGGTGLGLAIAKSIVELHGGTCFVHNTAMGVEFGFTLS